jgi:putative ABC transport system substrate-binding protein
VSLPVRAQQASLPVIGFISPHSEADLVAVRLGLTEAGCVEGRNVTIDIRWLTGKFDRAPAIVADLLSHHVAAIVSTTPGAIAAKAATSTIPIVFATGGDPVKLGLVASLNRPGGNVTGITFFGPLMETKRLGLLKEAFPYAGLIGVLLNPNTPIRDIQSKEINEAARTLGLQLDIQHASNDGDLDVAFAAFVQARAGALLVSADPFLDNSERVIALAARNMLPAIYGRTEAAEAGGLMSYGTNIPDSFRQAGVYAGQILKGAKPADLPVLQATKFEFVINLKTAKALGLTVPPTLLARADEVIE